MRTFGRVLAVMGVGLAVIGGIGAFAMLPRPVLEGAVGYVEEKRQTLRAHLPEMPPMAELITGAPMDHCAAAEGTTAEAFGGEAECASGEAADDGAEAPRMLQRSSGAATRFRAPAAETR